MNKVTKDTEYDKNVLKDFDAQTILSKLISVLTLKNKRGCLQFLKKNQNLKTFFY